MTQVVQLAPMTEAEARACVDDIKWTVDRGRMRLLELEEREGWAALGYASMEACAEAEFGWKRSYMYYVLSAARTQREMSTLVDGALPPLREYHLRQIAQLPPEERREVSLELARGNLRANDLRGLELERRTGRVESARRDLLASTPTVMDLDDTDRCWIGRADCGALTYTEFGTETDLIVTSPPYGLGLEGSDREPDLDWRQYLKEAHVWADAMYLAASEHHGRICLNIPLDRSKGTIEPMYADWVNLLREVGWRYKGTHVWKEGNTSNHQARGSVASPNAPHPVAPVEMVLVMYRGEWNRGEPKRQSDIAEPDWVDWLSNIWQFAGEHRYRVGHMAPFPEELARRLILLYSFPDDIVADPFCGSGTTPAVALRLGRRVRASDIDPECVQLTRARVAREAVAA